MFAVGSSCFWLAVWQEVTLKPITFTGIYRTEIEATISTVLEKVAGQGLPSEPSADTAASEPFPSPGPITVLLTMFI